MIYKITNTNPNPLLNGLLTISEGTQYIYLSFFSQGFKKQDNVGVPESCYICNDTIKC